MRQTASAIAWTTIYLALVALPLAVLLAVPKPAGLGFWWDFSMGLGFGGLAVMGAQFWLTARFKRLSAPFGVDILYYFHRWVAIGGLLLALAHFLVLRITSPESLLPILPPAAPWHMTAGRVALLLMLALVLTSVARKPLRLEYDRWRIGHAVMAVAAVVFAVWHVAGTGYYSGATAKMWTWIAYMLGWLLLGAYIRVVKPWWMMGHPYRVDAVQRERGRAWTLTLKPEGHAGLRFRPGQFAWLTLGHTPFAAEEHPFSIASSAEQRDRLQFTIKELGDFTRTVGQTAVGSTAYLDGPFGVFTPDLHPDAPGFVLIAGGVGIAPMMSMLRTFADRGERRPVTLVYGSSRLDSATFLEELGTFRDRLDLRVEHVLHDPPEDWRGPRGYITEEVLRGTLPDGAARFTYFLCGPEAMTDSVQRSLRRLGVPLRRIHVELFDMV
jgi:predicted ferric reductase